MLCGYGPCEFIASGLQESKEESGNILRNAFFHAKVYFLERRNGYLDVVIGSANCTHNGLEAENTEAVVHFTIKGGTVDAVKQEFIYDSTGNLRPYIERFIPGVTDYEKIQEVEAAREAEEKLKRLLDWIGREHMTMPELQ